MSTKQWTNTQTLADGKKIVLYSDNQQIILQLRHHVSAEEDILTPSFRIAITLTPAETIALATDLLHAVSPQLEQMQAHQTHQEEEQAVVKSRW